MFKETTVLIVRDESQNRTSMKGADKNQNTFGITERTELSTLCLFKEYCAKILPKNELAI